MLCYRSTDTYDKKYGLIVQLEKVYESFKTNFNLYDHSLLESTVLMPKKNQIFQCKT